MDKSIVNVIIMGFILLEAKLDLSRLYYIVILLEITVPSIVVLSYIY